MHRGTALLVVATTFALGACSVPTSSTSTAKPSLVQTVTPSPVATTLPAQPRLAQNPAQLADDLVADERVLRDPAATEAVLVDAARRQQVAYRTLARNPEWEAVARPRIRQCSSTLTTTTSTWVTSSIYYCRCHSGPHAPRMAHRRPALADELLNGSHPAKAKAASGVGNKSGRQRRDRKNHLGSRRRPELRRGARPNAIHALDVRRIRRQRRHPLAHTNSIMAAGRDPRRQRLRAGPGSRSFRYNNSDLYVRAVTKLRRCSANCTRLRSPVTTVGTSTDRTTAGDVPPSHRVRRDLTDTCRRLLGGTPAVTSMTV